MEISGKYAVITGASSGIGLEFAKQLHAKGANILLIARRENLLSQTCAKLNSIRSNSAEFLSADLTLRGEGSGVVKSLDQVADIIKARTVDILVNNAGFGSFGLFEQLEIAREELMVALNVVAPLVLTHTVIPQMKSRGVGAIINVSSVAAFQPIPYMATYAATKGFNFMHSLAIRSELSHYGVRVIALCPGPTETEFGGVARVPGEITGIHRDSVDLVVGRALSALASNRSFVVPGFKSWLISLASRIVPKTISTRITKRMLDPVFEHASKSPR